MDILDFFCFFSKKNEIYIRKFRFLGIFLYFNEISCISKKSLIPKLVCSLDVESSGQAFVVEMSGICNKTDN